MKFVLYVVVSTLPLYILNAFCKYESKTLLSVPKSYAFDHNIR